MPAATKTRPIKVPFKATTPPCVLHEIRSRYKSYIVELKDEDPLEDFFETDIAKRMEAKMTPALSLRTLRDAHGWSQAQLAEELGGVNMKRISDWENGRRAISKEFAKKLGKIFRFPADRFI